MTDLNKVSDIVLHILTENKRARNSDDILYKEVIYTIAQKEGWLVRLMHYDIGWFFENRSDSGLPPFESVRRSRQKIQHEHPELASTERVRKLRNENEKAYYDFARSERI